MSALLKTQEPSARYLAGVRPLLVEHFELAATAPGGVARLRDLILTLAVRGKLVPQRRNDEPAEMLLKRVRANVRLAPAGTFKRDRKLDAVQPDEMSYPLPSSWLWVRIGELGRIVGGGTPKSDVAEYWADEAVPWLTPADLYGCREKFICRGRRDISLKGLKSSSAQVLPAGAVLFSSRAPIGYVAIAGGPLATNQGFKSCVPHIAGLSDYLYWHLKQLAPSIDAAASGTTFKEISGKDFADVVIGLPPLAEQARIAARIEELMRLCDALEIKGRLEDAQHALLVNTLLGTLTDSVLPEELAANWQRIAAHFDLLLDRPAAVDALEQATVDMAVRGRFVLENSSDADNSSQAVESTNVIPQSEVPGDLPVHWRWVRLGTVAELINGDRGSNYPNRAEYVSSGLPFINTGHIEPDGTLSRHSMHYLSRKKFDSLRSGKVRPGDLVYCLRGATLGKTAIVEFPEGAIASSLVIIRLKECVDQRFAYYYLTGPLGRNMVRRFDNGSAQPNLAASSVKRYVIPLPPLAEQRRIVAHVDQLRRLCADLREKLTDRRRTQARLADAFVESTLAAD